MKTLIIMLLFFGGRTNVGSTIGGFHSLDACNKAIPQVINTFGETGLQAVSGSFFMSREDIKKEITKDVRGSCMELAAE